MKNFVVKFFGSKNKKEQIIKTKMYISAKDESEIEDILKSKYGYKVINGLKIRLDIER